VAPGTEAAALDLERTLSAEVDRVRATLLTAFRGLGFEILTSPRSGIEARRGSAVKAVYGSDTPVRAAVSLVGHARTCRVHIHLAATGLVLANQSTVRDGYAETFRQIQEVLDAALCGLDPLAATTWPEGEFTLGRGAVREQARGELSAVAGRVPGALGASLRSLVPGQDSAVLVVTPGVVARLDPDEVQTHLAVATMIAGTPGALPDNLAHDMEEVALTLARAAAAPTPPLTRVDVPPAHRPVYVFVHQQVLLRAQLPLREMQRCRECRFERVVNPDYQKMVRRNRRWQKITGLAGLTVTTQGVNMLLVAGRLFNLRQVDPDYVCPRCQGMQADVTLATICPGCGEVNRDPVLRRCPRTGCGFDFLGLLQDPPPLWRTPDELPEVPAVSAVPIDRPPPTPELTGPPAATAPSDAVPTEGVAAGTVAVAPWQVPSATVAPADPVTSPQASPAGWYPDPWGRHPLRYFDSSGWTGWASAGGAAFVDSD
jgi:hypothetical protein